MCYGATWMRGVRERHNAGWLGDEAPLKRHTRGAAAAAASSAGTVSHMHVARTSPHPPHPPLAPFPSHASINTSRNADPQIQVIDFRLFSFVSQRPHTRALVKTIDKAEGATEGAVKGERRTPGSAASEGMEGKQAPHHSTAAADLTTTTRRPDAQTHTPTPTGLHTYMTPLGSSHTHIHIYTRIPTRC